MSTTLPPGTILSDSIRIERVLNDEGGMGVLYEGTQRVVERSVAVKVMRPEFAANVDLRAKFADEATKQASVEHPNVVTVFAAGDDPQHGHWIAMQKLDGRGLDKVLEAGKGLELPVFRRVFRQLCAGVQAGHEKGVVHCDLKPENAFITNPDDDPTRWRLKVLDYGIVSVVTLVDGDLVGVFDGLAWAGRALRGGARSRATPRCRPLGRAASEGDVVARRRGGGVAAAIEEGRVGVELPAQRVGLRQDSMREAQQRHVRTVGHRRPVVREQQWMGRHQRHGRHVQHTAQGHHDRPLGLLRELLRRDVRRPRRRRARARRAAHRRAAFGAGDAARRGAGGAKTSRYSFSSSVAQSFAMAASSSSAPIVRSTR